MILIFRLTLLSAIFATATSCIGPNATAATESLPVQTEVESSTGPALSNANLTSEALQNLTASELANLLNDEELSIDLLNEAVKETDDPRIVEVLARRAISAERYDIAEDATSLWVKLVPNSVEAWITRAFTQLDSMADEQATQSFKNAVAASATDPEKTLQDISQILFDAMDMISAHEMYSMIVEANPNYVTGHLELFRFAIAAGFEADVQQKHIDDALAINPKAENVATAKFTFLIRQGKALEGEAYADEYLSEIPDAYRLRSIYAQHLSRAGLFRGAIDQYEKIPGTDALYSAANLYFRTDQYAKAYEKFKIYTDQVPGNQLAYLRIARAAMEIQKYDESAVALEKVNDNRLDFRKLLLQARLEAKSSSLQDGINYLNTLPMQSEGQRLRILLTLHELYREANQLEDSLKTLDDALLEFPGNFTLLLARSFVASDLAMVDVVEQDVRMILDRLPNNPQALNSLGYTLADKTDRHDEALELIESALENRPRDPYIRDSMGWVQYKRGNLDAAIDWTKRAYDQLENPVIAAHLGEIYWMKGESQKAKRVWSEANKRTPGNQRLLETMQKFLN